MPFQGQDSHLHLCHYNHLGDDAFIMHAVDLESRLTLGYVYCSCLVFQCVSKSSTVIINKNGVSLIYSWTTE